MAATWKGSISFGLVNIPVELYAAVTAHRPRFRLLHATDKSPVNYERVCQREGKTVAWADLVKGYEYKKGKYVVLTKEDFQSAAVEKSKTVDIMDFVEPGEIDDRYFDTPYYAVPGKGADRSYAVLREGIRKSGRIGVGKIVLRETPHLVALTVVEDALVLTMMRFADELVDVSHFKLPADKDVRPKEIEMATKLIESLSEDWQPEKYKDDYRSNLMRVIDAKLKGKDLEVEAEPAAVPTQVGDLIDRLRESLQARGKRGARARGTGKRRTRRAAA